MDAITLASQPFKITALTRKTRAELFKDAKVGDILRFSLAMTAPGSRTRGGQYATCIRVTNETQSAHAYVSLNEIGKRLDCFDIVPHDPAQVIPFPNAVADTLEHYAALARAGHVTGVVIAAVTPHEPLLEHVGVNEREHALLITELNDARLLALINE